MNEYTPFNAIVTKDIDLLSRYYEQNPPEMAHFLMAFSHRMRGVGDISKTIWQAMHESETPELLKFSLVSIKHKGALFKSLLELPDFQKIIEPYRDQYIDIANEKVREIEGRIEKSDKPESIVKMTAELEAFKSAAEKLRELPQVPQKEFIYDDILTLHPSTMRATAIDSKQIPAINQSLLLSLYEGHLISPYPLEKIPEMYKKGIKIRGEFESHSAREGLFNPLIASLNHDIAHAITNSDTPDKEYNSQNIWDTTKTHHDLSYTNFVKTSHKLIEREDKISSCIYVLLEGGSLVFGDNTHSPDVNRGRMCHHTDIAQGKPVLAAGMIYFDQEKKEILVINNQSGHYQPTPETSLLIIEPLKKLGLDISKVIVTDQKLEVVKNDTVSATTTSVEIKKPQSLQERIHSIRQKANPSENQSGLAAKFRPATPFKLAATK